MELIFLLMLALFAVITIKAIGFFFACLAIGFKLSVAAVVGLLIWNCIKAVRRI